MKNAFISLPLDIHVTICDFLSPYDSKSLGHTCTQFIKVYGTHSWKRCKVEYLHVDSDTTQYWTSATRWRIIPFFVAKSPERHSYFKSHSVQFLDYGMVQEDTFFSQGPWVKFEYYTGLKEILLAQGSSYFTSLSQDTLPKKFSRLLNISAANVTLTNFFPSPDVASSHLRFSNLGLQFSVTLLDPPTKPFIWTNITKVSLPVEGPNESKIRWLEYLIDQTSNWKALRQVELCGTRVFFFQQEYRFPKYFELFLKLPTTLNDCVLNAVVVQSQPDVPVLTKSVEIPTVTQLCFSGNVMLEKLPIDLPKVYDVSFSPYSSVEYRSPQSFLQFSALLVSLTIGLFHFQQANSSEFLRSLPNLKRLQAFYNDGEDRDVMYEDIEDSAQYFSAILAEDSDANVPSDWSEEDETHIKGVLLKARSNPLAAAQLAHPGEISTYITSLLTGVCCTEALLSTAADLPLLEYISLDLKFTFMTSPALKKLLAEYYGDGVPKRLQQIRLNTCIDGEDYDLEVIHPERLPFCSECVVCFSESSGAIALYDLALKRPWKKLYPLDEDSVLQLGDVINDIEKEDFDGWVF